MTAVTDRVAAALDRGVATVARAARRALERIAPETEAEAAPAPRHARKSKGWRRHIRAAKARDRG